MRRSISDHFAAKQRPKGTERKSPVCKKAFLYLRIADHYVSKTHVFSMRHLWPYMRSRKKGRISMPFHIAVLIYGIRLCCFDLGKERLVKAKGLSFNEKAVNLCISGPRIETERRSTVTRFDPVREEQVSCKSVSSNSRNNNLTIPVTRNNVLTII